MWLKRQDIPGLAMSRSLGDFIAQTVGVIPVPGKLLKLCLNLIIEVFEFKIEKEDRFIMIASDGVFEFLSNNAVMDIARPFY